jgi:hypothetical protein
MSEPILIALVQLFAIVSATRHHRQIKNTRLIIEAYLNQYLNGKELEEYLLLYDELFLFHIGIEEKTDLDSAVALEKILKICTKIGKSLQQKDKIIIFIKFIEFIAEISKDTQTTYRDKNQDLNYYQAVSSSFNLSESEYNTIISFILNPLTNNENENILAISSSPLENAFTSNTIFRDRLQGKYSCGGLERRHWCGPHSPHSRGDAGRCPAPARSRPIRAAAARSSTAAR